MSDITKFYDKTSIKNDNEINYLQNSCRLCLSSNQEILIFDQFRNNNIKYSEIAVLLADITIHENDNLPKFICQECSLKLISFYKFKQKCELSHCTLNALLGKNFYFIFIYYVPTFFSLFLKKISKLSPFIVNTIELDEKNIKNEEIINKEVEQHNNSNSDNANNDYETILIDEKHIEIESESLSSSSENDTEKQIIIEENNKNSTVKIEKYNRKQKSIINIKNIHQCDNCKKLFASQATLKQHLLTHLSEKPFSCDICNKKFTRKQHVRIHMRIHNNIKPYKCNECNRNFIKSSDLLRHMKVHSDKRDFICEICGKSFKRSSDIRVHMNSHTGYRPYSCKICNKAYFSHSSMMKHCRNNKHL